MCWNAWRTSGLQWCVPWFGERPWCLPLWRGHSRAALEQPSSREGIPCLECPSRVYEVSGQVLLGCSESSTVESEETSGMYLKGFLTCRATKERLCLNLQLGILSQWGLCSYNSQLESLGPLGSLKWGVTAVALRPQEWSIQHPVPRSPREGLQPLHWVCITRQDCTQSWQ